MNREMKAGEQCFRVIREFEKAPPDCPQTADGAALQAYLCPSGQWTLGFGCCYWHGDGRAVKQGETLDPSEVDAMLAYNVRYCEDYVRQHVTVELNQYQFDMLVSFRFNTRETTLRNSSRLLPAINAREWQKAASAFTEFVYGSTVRDGRPYQRAMRGLLRRRLWEGLIFLGLDPAEAVKSDDVALPCDAKLLSSGVWRDMIRSEGLTTLNQVKMKARPLPPLTEPADSVLFDAAPTPAPVPKPAQAAIPDSSSDILVLDTPASPVRADAKAGAPEPATQPAPAFPAPEQKPAASTSSGPSRDVAAPEAPKAAAPAKVPPAIIPVPPVVAGTDGAKPKSPNTTAPADVPYKIDPNAGLKPLEESERAKGYVVQQVGIGIIRLGSLGVFGTTIQGGAQVVQGDPVLSNIILMGFVAGGIAVVGYVVATYGAWKKKRGEQRASQGLF